MRDPAIENIEGQKVESHAFEHRVNWGYVALAIALIYVVMQVFPSEDRGNDEDSGGQTRR